jgi:sugar phosphate isomerase/epimerase
MVWTRRKFARKDQLLRAICLDHLSLSDLTAIELIEVAARLDCNAVSLFVTPLPIGPYRDLVNDRAARAEVRTALRDTGIEIGVIEPFLIGADIDWAMIQAIVELTAELGGTVSALALDQDRERLAASLGRLSELVRRAGTRMAIENFTLSAARTPGDALTLANAAGDDVGLTVDVLHIMRAGGNWGDVAALPADRIFHVQLSDGPRRMPADLMLEATQRRLPPGEGEFELTRLLPLLPLTARLAVEAPFAAPAGMTPLERGRQIVGATRTLLARSGARADADRPMMKE